MPRTGSDAQRATRSFDCTAASNLSSSALSSSEDVTRLSRLKRRRPSSALFCRKRRRTGGFPGQVKNPHGAEEFETHLAVESAGSGGQARSIPPSMGKMRRLSEKE